MTQNTIISVENVDFRYEDKFILKDFSYHFEKEIFTCIFCESGSGKSTLLRLINGLLLPEKGLIRIENEILTPENLIEKRLEMGYVLQGNSLFPHLTVFQNISNDFIYIIFI